jgi:hypothetical protein
MRPPRTLAEAGSLFRAMTQAANNADANLESLRQTLREHEQAAALHRTRVAQARAYVVIIAQHGEPETWARDYTMDYPAFMAEPRVT